ncbi:ATP-NAD kinase family protein [Colwellia sp. 4_MG-2023]|uniref:ATP-NAD kinase family protein n=1 Tax=unclassified Colwellia TaxID=196834 RepID=UPI0026E39782|nr:MULTISPECIES: ATP-NAD kinase family protein [unclassified Colwellia]MDO6507519.1 ATP-NAD kinase family protein [Colwellia sp. 5_MG-2023]MDO6556223.1 ATP-NAD kinase family protein [Colwellia sp. 4_MG-2023]
MMFKLGLVINPIAGIGGSVALKGSDDMVNHALALGAEFKANERTQTALNILLPYQDEIIIYTANNQMGEQTAKSLGFNVELVYQTSTDKTQAIDTEKTISALLTKQVDIILFAGGDGTARNIAKVVALNAQKKDSSQIPVLGIPAGCKIHSGVYAITPKAAGRVVELMVTKQLVTLTEGDVMDIDESLFRQGIVKAKRFGEMQIPSELRYIQAVKSGGKELDELVLQDISEDVISHMSDNEEALFIIGSGSTTDFLMGELGLDNTLLGVDLVKNQMLVANDVTEKQLWQHLIATKESAATEQQNITLVITLIGGQGHIFGRGNQQLSPRIIRLILEQRGGKDNIMIIATKKKLAALNNTPLISDTGDNELDQLLSGFMPITTGYKDQVLYPVSSPV